MVIDGIEFQESGSGDIPLLCLHGIGGSTESFRPQLDGLSAQFRVIAWNMPGYGRSEALVPLTFESLAETIVGFLDNLGLEKAHLVGQSIGGMIAQETAVRFPDRVASLVLIATTSAFGGKDDSFKEAFIRARLAPLDAGKTMPELAPSIVQSIIGSNADKEAIRSAIQSMSEVSEHTYRDTISCLTTFDRREEFPNLAMPVCLIAGGQDNNSPAKTMQKMAQKLPQSVFHEIAEAGHLVNLEAPEKSNELISAFLSDLEKRAE